MAFFWPNLSLRIQSLTISVNVRRFAQQLLITAIDATYAMGYIEAVFQSLTSRKLPKNVKDLCLKLAKNAGKHWWKHTKGQDLEDTPIYESVRSRIAQLYASTMGEYLEGSLAAIKLPPFHIAKNTVVPVMWS
ncbi:hypothetical protein HNQ59_002597 [Chitinivorax tropicus]|uniref:Uncharacterized protein n=1 Tax=Chitinivorax tropicus TaxID=714531 RepID=A0A840MQE2_9PROT|nr:hypothetical protein [Chitinivorax tropicus]MBB5019299.1 hypothetical protein [Chitinivorax tropicus]